MSAPNIFSPTTCTGKTAGLALTSTPTAIVSNASGSGKVIKVNHLSAANISAGNADLTVDVYKNATTGYRLAYAITVPVNATLLLLERPIYLEENDSIRCSAGGSSALEAVVSYEEIS